MLSFLEYSECTKNYLCAENLSCAKLTNQLVMLHPQTPAPQSPKPLTLVTHVLLSLALYLAAEMPNKCLCVSREHKVQPNSVLEGGIVQKHKMAQWLRGFNCIKHPQ